MTLSILVCVFVMVMIIDNLPTTFWDKGKLSEEYSSCHLINSFTLSVMYLQRPDMYSLILLSFALLIFILDTFLF